MPRNMSFFLTTDQVRNKTKTETRRLRWLNLKVSEVLNAVVKCQGLKKGEKIQRICQIRITEIRREPLHHITPADVTAEGFPDWTPERFIQFFCQHNKVTCDTEITVIRFEYL